MSVYIESTKVLDGKFVLWDPTVLYVGLLWHVAALLHKTACATVADSAAIASSAAVAVTTGLYMIFQWVLTPDACICMAMANGGDSLID